jgi:hypothetical protein
MSNLTHPEGVSLSLDDTRGVVHLWNLLTSAKSEFSRVHTVPTSCLLTCRLPMCLEGQSVDLAIEREDVQPARLNLNKS